MDGLRLLITTAAFLMGSVLPEYVQAAETPSVDEVRTLVRALAYDRRLSDRAGSEIELGIVYGAGSIESAARIAELFEELGALTIQGMPLHVSAVDAEQLHEAGHLDVLLLVDPDLAQIQEATRVAREHQIISAAFDARAVDDGCVLGVHRQGERASLVVNLTESRAAGVAFSPRMLQLAEVRR